MQQNYLCSFTLAISVNNICCKVNTLIAKCVHGCIAAVMSFIPAMAKSFFSLCILIQVTLGFLLAHVGSQVTVPVSEHGQDVQSCLSLYDESPCKTLT